MTAEAREASSLALAKAATSARVAATDRLPVKAQERERHNWATALVPVLVGTLLLVQAAIPVPSWLRSEPVRLLVFCLIAASSATWTLFQMRQWSAAEWARRRVPLVAVTLFLFWTILSASLSSLPGLSAYEALRHCCGGMLFVSVAYGISRKDVVWIGRIASLALTGAAVSGLVIYKQSGGTYAGGQFGDEQLLAAVLCVLLPLALFSGYRDPHRWWRPLGALAVMAGFAALVATWNRTAWVAVTVGIGLQLLVELRISRAAGSPRQVSVGAIVILAGALVVATLGLGQGTASMARVATLGAPSADATLRWRLEMWGTASEMLRRRPVLGWGVGTFPVHQARFRAASRSQRDILLHGATLSENAHNSYLQFGAETGYPGVVFYLSIPFILLLYLLRRAATTRSPLTASLVAASLGAVAAQVICGYANPAWEFAQCSVFQWFVYGVATLMAWESAHGDRRERP